MDKAQAEQLVISQFRALPPDQRKTLGQALAFADVVAAAVSFETLGNPHSIVRAWVAREFQGGRPLVASTRRTTPTDNTLKVVP